MWTGVCAVVGCFLGFSVVVCFGDKFLDDEEEEEKKGDSKKRALAKKKSQ